MKIKQSGTYVAVPVSESQGVDDERGLVMLHFDEALHIMVMTRDDALDFAVALVKAAKAKC